jgi:predicted Zn-dependent protease
MLSWDDAIADTTRALAASPELPSAVTAEATDIIAAGELAKHVGGPSDLRSAVERVIAEAGKPVADQAHGVTPQELAFAHLALARIEYARNEPTRARAEVKAAADLKIEDQRVAEDEIETLVEIGDYAHAHEAVDSALAVWPTSRRVRIASAQMAVAEGKPDLAIKILDATGTALPPLGQAVRGIARQATGDPAGARADLDAALQKLPNLEPALVGRAWLSLEAGAVDDAKKLIEPHYDLATASVPLATVYAAILRETNDASNRDKAKNVLLNVVSRPPSFDVARAQLELGRVLRDLGELPGARDAYAKAAQFAGASELGNQARLEAADLAIDSGDISGGAESFQNIQLAGPILVDAARARTLAGDPAGARKLLDQADATPGVPKWRIRRERARIAMRRDQPGVAIDYLTKALDESGEDVETMLLAADAAGAIDPVKDETHREFAGRVQTLIPEKLPDRPEALLVTGKLAFAAGKEADAQAAFAKALARLEAQHGSARRLAQATFGLAVVAYNQKADADAHRQFELVTHQDPSIYAAYLYMADLEAAKQPKHALELLQTAVTFAPESPSAWGFLGRQAQALNNQKVLADAIAKLTALDPNNRDLKDLVKPKKK